MGTQSMSKIKLLSPQLISKIAAGEVIERPAFVVKELIENSLDAGSTNITIEIEESGLKKIQVTDNGEGMSGEDLQEAVKIHTTSKIKEDTLLGISSFGFRGEALASIGAVSQLTIKSRIKKSAGGTQIKVRYGIFESIMPIGIPVGTTVIAENLFAHVPARKKFLKSSKTEFRHILDIVTKFALAFPNVRFQLIHNGKQIIDLAETDDVSRRIKFLFGDLIHNNLLPVLQNEGHIKLSGFVGHPQIATSKPSKQYLYVNGRSITNKHINLAISESFFSLLSRDQYPAYVLFVETPPETIDVNIHPRKELIAFFDDKKVFEIVTKSLEQTLKKNNLSFQPSWKLNVGESRITESFAGNVLREKSQEWDITSLGKIDSGSGILQVHNTYIVMQTKNGVVIVDQHAAHERILYEKLLTEFQKQKKKKQSFILEESVSLDLSLVDAELLRSSLGQFQKLGFDIEEFYENSFKVISVPLLFKDRDIQVTISELLEELLERKTVSDIDNLSQKMIAFLACRSSVMAGDKLSEKQMIKLIKELAITQSNITCPHGRPTRIEMNTQDLNKMFKRE